MKKTRNIYLVAGKRYLEMLGQWSVLGFTFALVSSIDHPIIVNILQSLILIGAIILLIYYTITNIQMIINNRAYKVGYKNEIIEGVQIEYAVGSFWDVAKKYEDDRNTAIIIGVNNQFKLDKDFIIEKSLIGEYISNNYNEKEFEELKSYMETQLSKLPSEINENNKVIYPYGSLIKLPKKGNNKFEVGLLSMCKENENGGFVTEQDILLLAIEKMFQNLSSYFPNYTVVVPLMGTDSAAIKLDHKTVAKYVISSFAHHTRIGKNRLAKRLVVSLYGKDFPNLENIIEVKNHIDLECSQKQDTYDLLKHDANIRVKLD